MNLSRRRALATAFAALLIPKAVAKEPTDYAPYVTFVIDRKEYQAKLGARQYTDYYGNTKTVKGYFSTIQLET